MIGAESADDYLLKAVRVFTAVFWAAALVLGEPCRKIWILEDWDPGKKLGFTNPEETNKMQHYNLL